MRVLKMRDRYDFSKSKPNPYAKKLKKQVTIRLDEDTIEYFKGLAKDKGSFSKPNKSLSAWLRAVA